MLSLSGHLGDRTAALVDGQLSADEAERAWRHVLGCPGCRDAVSQQAATKRMLGGLRGTPEAPGPRPTWLDPDALEAWQEVSRLERRAHRRYAAVGGGVLTASLALGAAVVVTGGLTGGLTGGDRVADMPLPAPQATVRGERQPGSGAGAAGDRRADAGWVGTSSGGETSRAVWAHGPRW